MYEVLFTVKALTTAPHGLRLFLRETASKKSISTGVEGRDPGWARGALAERQGTPPVFVLGTHRKLHTEAY